MAEGWLRHLADDRFDVVSAGTHPVGLNPYALTVMGEAGVDISHHVSERVAPYWNQHFHYVITVCDHAQEACPIFPGAAKTLHWNFDDPAPATGSYEQWLVVFRKSRDEIADRVRHFLADGFIILHQHPSHRFLRVKREPLPHVRPDGG